MTVQTRNAREARILFNGAVGVVLAVPIVRYLLSPVLRERKSGYESGCRSAPSISFPAGQTRLATYRNPNREPSMGKPRIFPAGSAISTARSSRYLRSIARTSAVRCAGFRNRVCSCVRATAAFTTPMARAPPGRRSAACSNTATRCEQGNLLIQAGEMPTTGAPSATPDQHLERDRHAPDQNVGDWLDARLQLGCAHPRDDGASRPAGDRKLGLRFRQRRADGVRVFSSSPAFCSR